MTHLIRGTLDAFDYEGLYDFDQSHPQGGQHGSSRSSLTISNTINTLYITLRVMMVTYIYN